MEGHKANLTVPWIVTRDKCLFLFHLFARSGYKSYILEFLLLVHLGMPSGVRILWEILSLDNLGV